MFSFAIEAQVGEKKVGPSGLTLSVGQIVLCYMSHVLEVGDQG